MTSDLRMVTTGRHCVFFEVNASRILIVLVFARPNGPPPSSWSRRNGPAKPCGPFPPDAEGIWQGGNRSDDENNRMLAVIEDLAHDFEEKHYSLPPSAPNSRFCWNSEG